MARSLNIRISSCRHKGAKVDNEDFFGTVIPKEPQLTLKGISIAIAAAGMSSSEVGKEASRCCVIVCLEDYYSTPDSWSVSHAGQKILSTTKIPGCIARV